MGRPGALVVPVPLISKRFAIDDLKSTAGVVEHQACEHQGTPTHRDPAPLDIDAEHGAGLGPQNVERTASRAKAVLSYVPDARMDTLQRGGVAADADLKHAGPYQRTPAVFQGDLAPVMMDGTLSA